MVTAMAKMSCRAATYVEGVGQDGRSKPNAAQARRSVPPWRRAACWLIDLNVPWVIHLVSGREGDQSRWLRLWPR